MNHALKNDKWPATLKKLFSATQGSDGEGAEWNLIRWGQVESGYLFLKNYFLKNTITDWPYPYIA